MADGEMHSAVTKIIGLYGDVMPTNSWIAATSRSQRPFEKPRLVNPSSGFA
jgi:hypothetical protein